MNKTFTAALLAVSTSLSPVFASECGTSVPAKLLDEVIGCDPKVAEQPSATPVENIRLFEQATMPKAIPEDNPIARARQEQRKALQEIAPGQ